jgi:hypothetical protein
MNDDHEDKPGAIAPRGLCAEIIGEEAGDRLVV